MTAPNFSGVPEPLILTRAQAQDAAVYRRARAQAEREGRELVIEQPRPEDNPWAPTKPAQPNVPAGLAALGPGPRDLDGARFFCATRAWLSNPQSYRHARETGLPIMIVDD